MSADGRYSGAWAGATALALLAELAYSQASGDDRFADLRSAWLEGLLALRIPGGGFRELPTSIAAADYLNGEAWLALAVYADMHPNEENVGRYPGLYQLVVHSSQRSPNGVKAGAPRRAAAAEHDGCR